MTDKYSERLDELTQRAETFHAKWAMELAQIAKHFRDKAGRLSRRGFEDLHHENEQLQARVEELERENEEMRGELAGW